MTIALLALGGLLCALGTRLGSVAFVAAATSAAVTGGRTAATTTWICAMAAGLALLGPRPRRLALPALGAAAVVAAAAASNSALVFAPWMVGTAAAVVARGDDDGGRRWSLQLVASDALVLAAVVWMALRFGFVRWPDGLDGVAATVLLLAGAARLPLVGSARAAEAGLVVVRGQVLVLWSLAIAAGPGRGWLLGAIVAGAAAFALGGSLPRGSERDAVQEASLFACAVGVTALGWHPAGWGWGALAAGTLIHHLRVSIDYVSPVLRRALRDLTDGGGFGLPLLPVVTAVVIAAAGAGSRVAVLVAIGLVGGLASRAVGRASTSTRGRGRGVPANGAGLLVLGGALGAGIWATLLSLPRPPAGEAAAWAPGWAVGLVAAAMVGGAFAGWPRSAAAAPAARVARTDLVSRLGAPTRLLDASVVRGAIVVPLGLLLAVGVGLWVLGLLRGFL